MGNASRQFLKQDKSVIGEGPAMCSSSEKPINVGDILYEGSVDEVYCKKSLGEERHKLTVTAHRVIQVNYQYRLVRIRCANGCEIALKFGNDSCSKIKYFHDLADLRKFLVNKVESQTEVEIKEVAVHQWRVAHLRKLKKDASTFNVIKIPAKV